MRFAHNNVCDMHTNRNAAFAGLVVGMFMAALDGNVVIAALPTLGAELGGGPAVVGITSAYLLAVAVTTPLHGSLGDRWGRRPLFRFSLAVFALGSIACALAPTLPVLIGVRALQGIGGGGLIVVAISAMTELFDRAELVRRQGWLTGMFAAASIGGAPLGGLLAAGPGWRWIFLVNLPICVVALLVGAGSVPRRRLDAPPPRRFDGPGAVLIAAAGGAVVLLGSFPDLARSPLWAAALLGVAVVAGMAFFAVERRAAAPLIPARAFTDPALGRSTLVTVLSGIALFGTFPFAPLVIGASPELTGLLLVPMSIGQVLATGAFSALVRRHPSVTGWGRLGLGLGVVGLAGLVAVALLPSGGPRTAVIVVALAMVGAALGLSMQAYTLVAQSGAPKDAIGATMATLTFARQLGGSFGIAAFGWLTAVVAGPAGSAAVYAVAAIAVGVAAFTAPQSAHEGMIKA